MESSNNRHAWLYQYKPSRDTGWHRKLRTSHQVDWRIIRWANDTKIGDLVLFWESGKEGGLRGYGFVSDALRPEANPKRRQLWRVPVRVVVWFEEVVLREKVIKGGAFLKGNLYLSMTQGANFPLEPQEVESFLSLMPPQEDLSSFMNLSPHPSTVPSALQRLAGSASDPEDVDGPFEGDEKRISFPGEDSSHGHRSEYFEFALTPATERIIRSADYRHRKLAGPLSTTRLFLSAFEVDGWPENVGLSDDEGGALTALRNVARRFQIPIGTIRKEYFAEQTAGSSTAAFGITSNARRLLVRAREMGEEHEMKDGLPAHLLTAALLTLDEGAVVDRMKTVGISLRDLQQQMLKSIKENRPDLFDFWEKVFIAQDTKDFQPTTVSETSVAVVGNDNAWSSEQVDSLGVTREAQAFAALTLSKHFIPPLAVGVFGDWGSGKSFFLRLVFDHIDKLSTEASKANGPKELLSDVVQIRFNAWHYMDTNLWASLVDHIFTELDKATTKSSTSASEALFEQLTTARQLTIESAERLIQRRREQEAAAKAVAEAERKLHNKQASVGSSPLLYWEAVKFQFLETVKGQENERLRKAAADLGIPGLLEDGKLLSDAIHQLEEQRGRANLLATGLRGQLGSWWAVLSFLGICLGLAAALSILNYFSDEFFKNDAFKEIWSQSLITTSSILTAITSVFAISAGKVKKAINALQSFREKFSQAAQRALDKPTEEVKKAQDELARLSADVAEGRARLTLSTEKLSEAARDYNAGTGKGRLLSFVRSRAANKDYAKHLGLVASIRKDFEELSDLIASATSQERRQTEPEIARERAAYKRRVEALLESAMGGEVQLLTTEEREKLKASVHGVSELNLPSLNRIVLYIDDLDRCQPEKVAEVLQAVHLLLSFRLFVVFVAVDVRWVTRALRTSYPSLLLKPNASHGNSAGATAHDYLEKIFQIPYWVRSMTAQSSRTFVSDRLKAQNGALAVFAQNHSAKTSGSEEIAIDFEHESSPSDFVFEEASVDQPAHEQKVTAQSDEMRQRLQVPHVSLSATEQDFMTELSCWAGDSPRRLLRFMNVYQVLKASLPTDEAVENDAGGFYELMAQVAIATASPQTFDAWFGTLTQANPSEGVLALVERMTNYHTERKTENALRDPLFGILNALALRRPNAQVEHLVKLAHLTRRFSFGAEANDLT